MSGVDSMSLSCGQALLDFVAASAAEFGGVGDMHGDVACAWEKHEETGSGVQTADSALLFDYLLDEELAFEGDLAERGYFLDLPLRNGLVFTTDEDLNVSCQIGAIVDQEDGRGFSIVFDPPLVDGLVGGDTQRPLADRVRVCCYLVRLACKAVGLLGEPLRINGDPVGFFRDAVGRLGQLVVLERLEQCGAAGDAADDADDKASYLERGHAVDSNPTESEVTA